MTRRGFMAASVAASAVQAARAGRVVGANDRIGIGMIGCGRRNLLRGVLEFHQPANVEVRAVCDTWRQQREKAAADTKEATATAPKQIEMYEDLLAMPEIDAVVAEMKGRATACVGALDAALADRPYLLGETMSAADLSTCYVLRGYRRSVSETLPDNAQAYFDRVTALPSYERTVKADAETAERLKS